MTGLAQAVVRVTGSRSEILLVHRAGVDVDLRVPKVDKAREVIGFEAEVDLDEGIDRTSTMGSSADCKVTTSDE